MAGRVIISQCVPLFLRVLRSRGVNVDSLRKRYGLPDGVESWPEAGLALNRLDDFANECAQLAGDANIGLTLGGSLERGAYGLLEFAVRTSPTVREGLGQLKRYSTLLNGLVDIDIEEGRRSTRLVHRLDGEPHCVGRHCNEFTMAAFLRGAQDMTAGAFRIERVQFATPDYAGSAALRSVFGDAALDFDRGENALVFATAMLDLRTAEADGALAKVLAQHAAREAALRPKEADLRSEVRATIRAALKAELPQLDGVAKQLGMSDRTLQRRLGELDSSFARELEAVRGELAKSYVKNPQIPFAEIAFTLRYSDLRAFARAFKRWTGKTLAAARSA